VHSRSKLGPGRLLGRAFVASLVIHALVALLFPNLWLAPSGGVQPVETISLAHVSRVRLVRPTHPAARLPAALPKTAHRALPALPHTRTELSAHTTRHAVQRAALPATTRPASVSANNTVRYRTQALYAQPTPATAPIAAQTSSPPPHPAPSSQVVADRDSAPSAAGRSDAGGVLPFGAELAEPVLDPKVRSELAKRFGNVHTTLTVVVGDDGRTKAVDFRPPIDAQTESQIRAILAQANWDPAVRGGGVATQAQAVIRI